MTNEYELGYQQCLTDVISILENSSIEDAYYNLCDFVNDNCKEGDDND